MRVLILGGNGFIGLEITRALHGRGHDVIPLARNMDKGRTADPNFNWVAADIASLTNARDWHPFVQGIDAVVNASGALQDSARDDVRSVQDVAIQALVAAAETAGVERMVQISAVGAKLSASTRFLRSKARADERVRNSALHAVILRPGLVIGRNAYGGNALLRALAVFPVVQPVMFATAQIQTIGLAELVETVCDAVDGKFESGTQVDLVEAEARSLQELIIEIRSWLGVAPAKWHISIPNWLGACSARIADMLGVLGWRSPLRSTALRVLGEDVRGDAAPMRALLGHDFPSLRETLRSIPAGIQERWFARLYLALPIMVAVLSVFWLLSGLIGLISLPQARAELPAWLGTSFIGTALVIGGALVDLMLGALVLWRPWAKRACIGMVIISLVYIILGTVLSPQLWVDPMGPFVKILPAMVLAWVTSLILDER